MPTYTPVATDDFNRASIGSNWTGTNQLENEITIYSSTKCTGATANTSSNRMHGYWSGTGTFSDDQYSQIVVTGVSEITASYSVGVGVRNSTDTGANRDGYWFEFQEDSGTAKTTRILKVVNGSVTQLSTTTINWADGDTMRLDIIGSDLKAYRNDTLISALNVTDTALTTGKPGITGSGGSSGPWADSWVGGDVTAGAGGRTTHNPRSFPLGVRLGIRGGISG